MSDEKSSTVLYAPDGRRYVAGDVREVTRLKSRGYTTTPPRGRAVEAPKPTDVKPAK